MILAHDVHRSGRLACVGHLQGFYGNRLDECYAQSSRTDLTADTSSPADDFYADGAAPVGVVITIVTL